MGGVYIETPFLVNRVNGYVICLQPPFSLKGHPDIESKLLIVVVIILLQVQCASNIVVKKIK